MILCAVESLRCHGDGIVAYLDRFNYLPYVRYQDAIPVWGDGGKGGNGEMGE